MPSKATWRTTLGAGQAQFLRVRVRLALVVLFTAVLCFAAGYFVLKPPPDTIVISTGVKGGAYALFGERYRKILAREGVHVVLENSSGSVENLKRLTDRSRRIDVGFVQNGSASQAQAGKLVSLGAICYSPLWVFYRGPETLDDLSQLKGKRIAIGAEGSGVRSFAKELLRVAKVTEPPATLLDFQGASANAALRDGIIDAVMITGTEDNELIRELLYAPSVKLMNVRQAEAYTRLIPALSHVVLPAGILDVSRRHPAEDVHLLSPMTSLIVRRELHPTLIYLLVDAAVEAHSPPGWLNKRSEFPAVKELDYPISEYAERFYKSGRPLLLDYLPFRVATVVDRLFLVLLPVAFLIGPFLYIASMFYAWRSRRKLYRHYRQLKRLEAKLKRQVTPAEREGLEESLDQIDDSLNRLRMPSAFLSELYMLKDHVELVRRRLSQPRDAAGP